MLPFAAFCDILIEEYRHPPVSTRCLMLDLSLPKREAMSEAEGRDLSDASLTKASRRDPAAFARLYRRYVTPVYRYLYSRVGNGVEAEDLTAQVFIDVLEGLDRYRERGTFAAWLFTIARHKAADHHRQQHPHLSLDEVAGRPTRNDDPLDRVMHREELERLADLVAQVDEEEQDLLRLRFAAGLTYAEIGEVTGGRSQAAVKMAIHRLLRRLKARWEESDE
jgi:RNA polymerase sigma factor (sigma-70 family)